MGKILKFFLILFAVVGIVVIGFVLWGMSRFSIHDPAMEAEANSLIPSIVAHWDDSVLMQHVDTTFKIGSTDKKQEGDSKADITNMTGDANSIKTIFADAKNRLGEMKKYTNADCVSANIPGGKAGGACVAPIEFEKGTATIVMGLSKDNAQYKIQTFMVDYSQHKAQ